ncbi:MAG: P27 family phage terminase small subunit [Xanthobacteraceae bacterium]|nr:P27 family phage terminase small subunit [Xanthobacteraceae bacterium]
MRGVKPKLVVVNDTVTKAPSPPSGMSAAAKSEWKRVVPDLASRGLFTDPPMVENYCNAIAGAREAAKARRGKVMLGSKAHPAVRMEQQYLEISRRYAAEIGLTPMARSRTGVRQQKAMEDDDENPLNIS